MLRELFFYKKENKPKMYKLVIFLIIIFGNYWIWRIFSYNFILGFLIFISSLAFVFSSYEKKFTKLAVVLLIPLVIFQIKIKNPIDTMNLTESQEVVRSQRIPYYSSGKLNLITRGIRYVFEVREETVIISNVLQNMFEVIDPNLYFFANHPRERVGVEEFNKFPFIFIFLFWVGLLEILALDKDKLVKTGLPLTIFLLGFIGSRNDLGPFILFPFVVYILWRGTLIISEKFKVFENRA